MPGTSPDFTSARIAFLLRAPCPCRYSAAVSRDHMHQQPAHAPFLPNSFSKSAHRAGVSGWKLSSIGRFVTGNLHPGNPECARLDTAVAGADCTPARKKGRGQGMKRFKFSEAVSITALVLALFGYGRAGYGQEEFVAHCS